MANLACKKLLECIPPAQAALADPICIISEMIVNADEYGFSKEQRKSLAEKARLLDKLNRSFSETVSAATEEAVEGMLKEPPF